MKKQLLTAAACVLAIGSSIAQNYPHFLHNSSWNTHEAYFGGDDDFFIKPEKDTVINGLSYVKYDKYTYLREDVAAKKVYAYVSGNDQLKFDFSMQIGDYIDLYNGNYYMLSSTDSVPTLAGKRKRYHLQRSGALTEIWIEGVGYPNHPLRPAGQYSDPVYNLNCSYQNGETIFNAGIYTGNTATNCPADPFAGLTQLSFGKTTALFPNPTNGIFSVRLNETPDQAVGITVYNALGEIEYQSEIQQQITSIDFSGKRAGIYLVRIQKGGEIIQEKVVIQ